MLTLLLIIPIIGSLFILSIQENSLDGKSKMRKIAISTSLINLLISIVL
jgi:NADH-ubiquinone oxidoreductase chain 4